MSKEKVDNENKYFFEVPDEVSAHSDCINDLLVFFDITKDQYLDLLKEWISNEDAVIIAACKGEKIPSNPGLFDFLCIRRMVVGHGKS